MTQGKCKLVINEREHSSCHMCHVKLHKVHTLLPISLKSFTQIHIVGSCKRRFKSPFNHQWFHERSCPSSKVQGSWNLEASFLLLGRKTFALSTPIIFPRPNSTKFDLRKCKRLRIWIFREKLYCLFHPNYILKSYRTGLILVELAS